MWASWILLLCQWFWVSPTVSSHKLSHAKGSCLHQSLTWSFWAPAVGLVPGLPSPALLDASGRVCTFFFLSLWIGDGISLQEISQLICKECRRDFRSNEFPGNRRKEERFSSELLSKKMVAEIFLFLQSSNKHTVWTTSYVKAAPCVRSSVDLVQWLWEIRLYIFTTSSFLYILSSTLGEPKPSRFLQVSNSVSLLASRERASIIALEFTPHSLRPAAQAMNAPAVIAHSQKLLGSFIQHSLNLFPEKMPMDAPSDCHENEGIMNRLLWSVGVCTAHTVHCIWNG